MVVRAPPPVELPPRVLSVRRDRCGARERCCAEKENESGRSRSAKRLLSRVELRNHLARRWLADGPLEGAHNARGQGSNGEARESLNSAPEKRYSARPDEGLRALGEELESRERFPTHLTRWSRTVVQSGAAGKKKMNCNSTLGQKSKFLME